MVTGTPIPTARRAREIFELALDIEDESARLEFVQQACEKDEPLRLRVEQLLQAILPAKALLPDSPVQAIPTLFPTDPPGTMIGRYKLLQKIGEGGMGIVYMAEQREPVSRRVALKIIKLGLDTRQVVARFEAERQALALMDHPHIAKVLDGGVTEEKPGVTSQQSGSDAASTSSTSALLTPDSRLLTPSSGRPFFVMELVQGVPITEFSEKNHLSALERLQLFIPVCQAIQHAHHKGVIHRDLKPSNVLVTLSDGVPHPMVIDFGVAKALNQRLTEKTLFTQFATMIGTPAYMSPEQAEMSKLDVDTRSDIYSLGALLYELLTGSTPFPETRLRSVGFGEMQRIIAQEEPERPSTRLTKERLAKPVEGTASNPGSRNPNSSIDPDLDWIVLKCLEKDRSRRYETATGLAADIQRFIRGEPIEARPPSAAYRLGKAISRNRVAFAAAAVVVLALVSGLGLAGLGLRRERAARAEAERSRQAEATERQRAEVSALQARRAQYASDMNLAHQAVKDGDVFRARQLLERHRRQESGDRSQETEIGTFSPANPMTQSLLTPDSRLLTPDLRGWEWGYLWRETQGDPHRVLLQLDKSTGPIGVLPDGKTLFVGSEDKTLRFLDLESGREVGVLLHPEALHGATTSPDGRWLLTGTRFLDFDQPIQLWSLASKTEVAILSTNFWPRATMAFSPDSRRIAFFHVPDRLEIWDVIERKTIASFRAFDPGIGPMGVSFTPDGRWLAFAENDRGSVVLLNTSTWTIDRRWLAHTATVRALAFSPDGETLATCGNDGFLKLWDVPTLQERVRYTGQSRWLAAVAFSPDGQWLASSSGAAAVWLLNAKTGERVAEMHGHLRAPNQLAFTRDSRQLLSTSDDGSVRVWTVPPSSREPDSLALPADIATQWVTYGPSIAFAPDASAAIAIFTNFQHFSHWRTDAAFGTRNTHHHQVPPGGSTTGAGKSPSPPTATPTPHSLPVDHRYDSPWESVAAVAPGGGTVAFGSHDGSVVLWDASTGRFRHFARAINGGVNRITFSRDGTRMAFGNLRALTVWSVKDQRELHAFPLPNPDPKNDPQLMSLEFSARGGHIIAGYYDGSIRVHELTNGGNEIVLRGHQVQVRGLALLPDNRTLVSTGGEVRVWDIVDGRELFQLAPQSRAFSLALSPDGRRLAIGDSNGSIRIWDTSSWNEVATLNGHADRIYHLAFSADGQTLLSASRERLRVWRADAFVQRD